MKLSKCLSFLLLVGVSFGSSACVMHDGAGERRWTVGTAEHPVLSYVLSAEAGTLDTTASLDPTQAVDYAAATVKRWVAGLIGMFPAKAAVADGG